MSEKTLQQKAAEAHNMCRIKGDSMLDNSDREVIFDAEYDTEQQALTARDYFIQKARDVENEPANIDSEITALSDGFRLKMHIIFSCQAEVVLFQMAIR
ncbi:hypothetical protein B0186_01730 [Canicola haemoglobinophilus]|uniref:tRNA-dihydrouridine synthase A n=1 Tax=Canicola haemoglobinophilus TaxID=733 RepID=A0A1V4B396_9PAST|nr:YfcZ/YiiS family protein [Canicola haemoglobinophilus]MBN6709682.1 YfcZ/YiiS family protein [Canicola haemoglobinophilus]OOS01794.1 hypothetical protein B0186_01730 [Canicola haemoglobinophilus]STO53871.1 tRNA-dihydrouridine synthase A [Canicola haemoglobinophilus]STO60688.1 tRNA-dihydrouridine synthase A [Canicola haemoglobinophilus]STO68404.1 tRNA-dihydrouridine synthase A [Canicola haemoglobinophilus]